MPDIDGAAFSAWLGERTLLLWGDSLSAQLYYSLLFLLGTAVATVGDYESWDALTSDPRMSRGRAQRRHGSGRQSGSGDGVGSSDARDTCSYTGVGAEGGPLTAARLLGGGRLLKVLGHAEMASQAKDLDAAWWRPAWEVCT